ncbi:hypothetical protein [uncultured Campylobacter sp.]|mgnify:FL=1|uniref:hypothetical protein n=1 Tax=uncultured Campylobacter sp. TaxID=218934 RepID=UPI00261189AB|nr:hypothetical protein [uncultured Campylobacter sp.]
MKTMQKGFALVAAIFFIIIVATTAITALSIASMTARDVNNIQGREQALLLAQSATELAVLAMQKHQYLTTELKEKNATAATNPTLNTITLVYPSNDPAQKMFDITVTFGYFDTQLGAPGNHTVAYSNFGQGSSESLANGSVGRILSHAALVDVIVESNTAVMGTPKVRYHRRTIQKP